jgi:predicted DNA binding protein
MSLFEVAFRISHDYPFGNISRKFESMKMFTWCNREHDVIEFIMKEPDDYPALMNEISNLCGVIDRISDGSKVHVVTKNCCCDTDNSVVGNIGISNLLHIAPIIYENGWEYYRIIAFRHKDLEDFLQRIQKSGFKFEILRKVPFNGSISSSLALTAGSLFSNLTEKQIDAVVSAYANGYFLLPRKTDVKEIAFRKQVSRTTFQEHLSKAENKIMAALIPYIKLFNFRAKDRRKFKMDKQKITSFNSP